jgi:hypothetical protein
MQAIDRLARHRGLYHDALVNVNQVMGFNLSVLSDDELDAFKRLTEKITVRASESDEK